MKRESKKRSAPVSPENDQAPYFFHQGTNTRAYEYMGAHLLSQEPRYRYVFRVWAPHADSVFIIGDFNGWHNAHPMTRVTEAGVWEGFVEADGSLAGNCYKFRIYRGTREIDKADPYAFFSETREKTASILCDGDAFLWQDDAWLRHRKKVAVPKTGTGYYPAPMNVYEMHLGSWKTRDGQSTKDGQHDLSYRELADDIASYVKEMGYTHIELMPIAEHPFDGSWGYQVVSYYAPTSRFGRPEDFKYFVDRMHRAGIGVILDWVPAHFPKDAHGLYEFDGDLLYEYQGWDRMEHQGWGTRCFDLGRTEVQSFLVSNALFWMREYHIDGLRVDAVAAMLYLDFDRRPGEWIPNAEGGNQNFEAIAFFQKLNTAVFAEFPDMLMIAEESTSWPMITKSVDQGGLGFNFKWNMGWANDMFEYVATDPIHRKHNHEKLTFPMMYAFSENFILPVSHDEVVHGKKSLIDKMWGSYEEKFAGMRTFLLYMMTFPGKKMTFMGCEYGQFREWDYENQLEWFMLGYPMHQKLKHFVSVLNGLYLAYKPLWELDFGWEGFSWIDADNRDENIISYKRKDSKGKELIVVLNFAPVTRHGYTVHGLEAGTYRELLSTDADAFGGWGTTNPGDIQAKPYSEGDSAAHAEITLPSLGGVLLQKAAPKKPRAKIHRDK